MKILVLGTGAIGGFYGGKLAQSGAQVSVVCRSDYEIVKEHGIQVKSVWGDFHFIPYKVLRTASDFKDSPDFLLVTLKVLPDIEIPKLIQSVVSRETAIVLLMNGVEIEKPIANAFPDNEIISGLAFVCVNREAPGLVHHLDYGRLVIGRFPQGLSQKTRLLARLFDRAGIPCEENEDIVKARWQKLIWNAPFNPVSVLGGGLDTSEMLKTDEMTALVRNIMEEISRIAEATGHKLPVSVIEKNISDTYTMKPYKTSMLIDYEAKRPMEVEAILGNALRVAKEKSLNVPHLQTLYALLHSIDQKNCLGTSK